MFTHQASSTCIKNSLILKQQKPSLVTFHNVKITWFDKANTRKVVSTIEKGVVRVEAILAGFSTRRKAGLELISILVETLNKQNLPPISAILLLQTSQRSMHSMKLLCRRR